MPAYARIGIRTHAHNPKVLVVNTMSGMAKIPVITKANSCNVTFPMPLTRLEYTQ